MSEIQILLVEDNEGDILLTLEAFKEIKVKNSIAVVKDGVEAIEFLKKNGQYADSVVPHLILLDINMPKKTGFEALKEMRAEPGIGVIPVVILTASNDENDVRLSYRLGANAFMTKPLNFQDLCKDLKTSVQYWLETCVLLAEEDVDF